MGRSEPPWEVYATALFPQGYGYPLWHPQPTYDSSFGLYEVEIGSVGWIHEGRFPQLFNARKPRDDPINVGRVPESFEHFSPPNIIEPTPRPVIVKPFVTSRYIRIPSVEVEGLSTIPNTLMSVSAEESLSFKCSTGTGALLLLGPPAMKCALSQRRHIVNYLRKHVDA
ncbi:hypothetical protein DICSQDRAFT_171261 [Dichomitus squalens LYAD-421 SS1]|uniref:Uncharacterized protein n=1 Tax=Dichomitus squalens (strain LYAD-421) TaxID=732165 RepID=R7SW52_DICSQ|nr:uncharacterized protein DICSQDRAFT_171261 [Dichomitus squalens LYAD-421 SS1]EJF60301.1 hypothetical protein DICSQDRAFT_171261 [Dichomitus squalens LYAD-421 SS1]